MHTCIHEKGPDNGQIGDKYGYVLAWLIMSKVLVRSIALMQCGEGGRVDYKPRVISCAGVGKLTPPWKGVI